MSGPETPDAAPVTPRAPGLRGDLARRLRTGAWYVAFGVTLVLTLVAAVIGWVFEGFSSGSAPGLPYSLVVFVLLAIGAVLTPLFAVAPAPDAATPVPARWLAAWVHSLGLVVAALPVLLITALPGGVSPATFVVSLLLVALEFAVFTAIAVSLAALVRRRGVAVLVAYLALAVLCLGTTGVARLAATEQTVTVQETTIGSRYDEATETVICLDPVTRTTSEQQDAPAWGLLVLNPFVTLGDAAAFDVSETGIPRDLFGQTANGLRDARDPVTQLRYDDECGENATSPLPDPPFQPMGAPLWYLGLGAQLGLAALLLAVAALRERGRRG